MKNKAEAVSRTTLPEQVAATLRREIFTGTLAAGDRLDAERELAGRFKISRVTLRKALALLAQEGWIEIVQGRKIAVKNFRTSVGLEVLPELFFAYPQVAATPGLLETVVVNSAWLYEQILVAAAKKARPSDQPRLLALLALQTDELGLEEFYENDFRLGHELLRIGGNLVLQMAYNSQIALSRKLLALGLVKEPPFPLPRYHEINRGLIKAVCAGDERAIRRLLIQHRSDLEDSFKRLFKKAR